MQIEKTHPEMPQNLDPLRPELIEAWGTRELRRDWRVNLSNDTAAGIIFLLMGLGAWGVLSGFAVFVLLHESVTKFPLLVFLSALLVAAVVGLFTEYLRERIEHAEPHAAPAPAKPHGLLRRLPVTVLMLGLFELFISAWHGASEMGRAFVVDAGLLILGDDLGSRLNAPWAVAALAVLWIVEGAFLAAVLGGTLTYISADKPPATGSRGMRLRRALKPSARCGMIGGAAGALAGGVGLLVTVVLMRIIAAISLMIVEPRQWLALVQAAPEKTGITTGPLRWTLFAPVQILSEIMVAHRFWGPVGAIAAVGVLVKVCKANKVTWPLWILGIGLFVVMMAPLVGNVGAIFFMALLAAIVWAVPGICLGASVPLLRGPATAPRVWGFAAFLAAAALVVLSYVARNGELFPLVLGLALIVGIAGIIFWRGGELKTYWPLAALVLAAYVGLFTAAQQATFHGVLDKLSAVIAKPGSPGTTPQPTFFDWLKNLKQFKHDDAAPDQPLAYSRLYQPGQFIQTPLDMLATRSTTSAPASTLDSAIAEQLKLGHAVWQPPPATSIGHAFDDILTQPPTSHDRQEKFEQQSRAAELNARTRAGENLLAHSASLIHDQELAADKAHEAAEDEIKDLEEKSKDISQALQEYLDVQPARAGDPDQWPDRRAKLALQDMTIREHLLRARAEGLLTVGTEKPLKVSPAELFELSITGSLAFWVTVGLLVGWSSRQHQPLLVDAGDGKKKCFWGTGPLADYHDHLHGKTAANDGELFERLALCWIGGESLAKRKELKDHLKGLDFEVIAALPQKEEYAFSGGFTQALGQGHRQRGPALVALARRFRDLRLKLPQNQPASNRVLLEDWTARAAADAKQFVVNVRQELALPAEMRAGTFLQSIGLVEGAHFKGCSADSVTSDKVAVPPDR